MKKIKTLVKGIVKSFLLTIPFVKTRIRSYDYLRQITLNIGFPPGHYHSPLPNLAEIERDAYNIFVDKDMKLRLPSETNEKGPSS